MNDGPPIAVLVPVLDRPANAAPLAFSARASAVNGCRVVFLCTPGDTAEIAACKQTGADVIVVGWENGPGDYARKINHGYQATREPYVFLAADDLVFHPGWDMPLLELALAGFGVIGSNDLGNPDVIRGTTATHQLVSRSYADACGTVDECGKILHDGYAHNFVDTELVATAKARGAWAFARDAHVEHNHPFWRKGADDDTYVLGRSGLARDAALFGQRRLLWEHGLVAA